MIWRLKNRVRFALSMAVISMVSLFVFAGCAGPAVLNPYVLLERVDSVDHTPFFIATYDAFQAAGLDTILAEQVQTQAVQETQEVVPIPTGAPTGGY